MLEGLRFSPDGRWLAAADDSEVCLWDAHSGDSFGRVPAVRVVGFERGVPQVVVAREDATVWWDVPGRCQVRAMQGFSAYGAGCSRWVGLSSSGEIQVREADGAVVASWSRDPGYLPEEGLALSPDDGRVALATGGEAVVYDAYTGREMYRLSTPSQRDVTCVAFGDLAVAFGTMGGTLAVHWIHGEMRFQAAMGAEIRSVHFSRDDTLLAVGCSDQHERALVLAPGGSAEPLVADCGEDSFSVRISPDGPRLAVGSAAGKVRIYRLPLSADAPLPSLETGLELASWAVEAGRPELSVGLVERMRADFPEVSPQQRGRLEGFEFEGLYRLGRWHEAYSALAGWRGVAEPQNEAWRYSVAVELAHRLGRFDDIPGHADRCMAIRRSLGDEEGVEMCRRMTVAALEQAGRPELARRYQTGWKDRLASWFRRS